MCHLLISYRISVTDLSLSVIFIAIKTKHTFVQVICLQVVA